jgi:hypothetical protein
MWRRVDLMWTDVSEERNASIYFSTLKMEAIHFSETSAHTRSTRHHIQEDGILHSRRRENIKSYITSPIFAFSTQRGWGFVDGQRDAIPWKVTVLHCTASSLCFPKQVIESIIPRNIEQECCNVYAPLYCASYLRLQLSSWFKMGGRGCRGTWKPEKITSYQ